MQKEFWHDKWQADQIGFHLESAHPLLRKFYKQAFANSNTVFVPLCGKSKDLFFLSEQGFRVLGSELSEKAVKAFYTENYQLDDNQIASLMKSENSEALHQHNSNVTAYSYDSVTIYQGDFFQLQSEQLDNTSAIYDRAALIALPESMRFDYVKHLRKLFKSARLLLITLEYDQKKMSGPPFSVSQHEVNSLFEHAQIEMLYSKDIIEKEPRFKSKGLESFIETAYQITW